MGDHFQVLKVSEGLGDHFQVLKVSEWVGDHFQVLEVSEGTCTVLRTYLPTIRYCVHGQERRESIARTIS